ncbi:MAG: c-type cytochrome [Steroidobacteraceae bacterium]
MTRWRSLAWALALPIALRGVASGYTPNATRGEQIYVICDACHGPGAQGEERLQTPGLVGQPEAYLLRQLRNFRGGRRGGNNDTEGQQMRQILEVVSREEDWQDVLRYIRSLPAQAPPATLHADIEKGRKLYVSCAACHGSRAEGNEALNAPPLRWLADWYIVRQLQKFRAGVRGAAADDAPGNQMRAISQKLRSDSDIAAVASYIGTGFGY